MRSTNPRKLEQALDDLIRMVHVGKEYPDAEYRAAMANGVNPNVLRDAYDEHCRSVRIKGGGARSQRGGAA